MKSLFQFLLCIPCLPWFSSLAADWPQGPGPNFDFTASATETPDSWSASPNRNVAWRTILPETGQSTPVVWKNRVFLTTMKPVVGRGGGHGPPEKPEGVSMIRAEDGDTLWTLELPAFMSTQTYPVVDGHALVFHKGDHLRVDAKTGKIARTVSIVKDVPVRRWTESGRTTETETLNGSIQNGTRSRWLFNVRPAPRPQRYAQRFGRVPAGAALPTRREKPVSHCLITCHSALSTNVGSECGPIPGAGTPGSI